MSACITTPDNRTEVPNQMNNLQCTPLDVTTIRLSPVTAKGTFTRAQINKKQAPVKSPPNSTHEDKVLEIWNPKMGDQQQRRLSKTMKGDVMENRNVYLCLRLSKTSVIVE